MGKPMREVKQSIKILMDLTKSYVHHGPPLVSISLVGYHLNINLNVTGFHIQMPGFFGISLFLYLLDILPVFI